MAEFYYNSLYRQESSNQDELSIPIEEKDDIFDDNRNKHYPVGSVLGSEAGNNCNHGSSATSPSAGTMNIGTMPGTTVPQQGGIPAVGTAPIPSSAGVAGASTTAGTVNSQGTTTPSVPLPSTGTASPSMCGSGSGSTFPVDNIEYTQGYLRTRIGSRVRVQFLLGTGTFQDRTGILIQVGISYIILREEQTNVNVLCDIYSIKFVDFF